MLEKRITNKTTAFFAARSITSFADQSYSGDGYERFRRGAEDGEEWTRVLSLLDTGTQLYTGLDQQAEQAGCRAKLACQALETPDILGKQTAKNSF